MFWFAWRLFAIEKMDQRIYIKFCVKNKIKCSEVLKILTTAFAKCILSQKNVYNINIKGKPGKVKC